MALYQTISHNTTYPAERMCCTLVSRIQAEPSALQDGNKTNSKLCRRRAIIPELRLTIVSVRRRNSLRNGGLIRQVIKPIDVPNQSQFISITVTLLKLQIVVRFVGIRRGVGIRNEWGTAPCGVVNVRCGETDAWHAYEAISMQNKGKFAYLLCTGYRDWLLHQDWTDHFLHR